MATDETVEKSAKPFTDVAKPGGTPASATSRPIIVRHSAGMKHDPMVKPDEEKELDADGPEKIQSHTARKISPTVEPELSDTEEAPAEVAADDADAEEKQPAQDDQPNTAVVDTLVNEVSAKRQEQKDDEALAAKYQEAEKIIQSKEFFVPIGEASRRRSNNRALVGLVLFVIVVVVGVNFAIDAELIDVGVNSLTNIL